MAHDQNGNGRWRVLAQALVGVLLTMILAGMGIIWHELANLRDKIDSIAIRQAGGIASREAAVKALHERVQALENQRKRP